VFKTESAAGQTTVPCRVILKKGSVTQHPPAITTVSQ